jgi:HEAT repeat protein
MDQQQDDWWTRIESGTATAADLQRLRDLLMSPDESIVQFGKYNVHIGQGQEIQIGDRMYVEIDDEAIRAIATAIRQHSKHMNARNMELIDFQAYLQSILDDEDYREWQDLYTPTTVEGKKQTPQPKFSPRLKLRVTTVKPKEEERDSDNQREQVEQWEALAGLRQYARDHVLLIGKPGSGKSTSLERLLWEDASNALHHPDAKIPVLVKLRRCTSNIEELIQNFFSRHQLSLTVAEIENLLNQNKLMLLLDGLNELPEAFRRTIANFRDKYRSTTPMVFSTRDLGIGGTLDIKKTLKMLPLTEPQMQEFVQGYLGEEGTQLFQQLKGDRLRKFAETPLLLWMLCRVFAQNGQVPANLGLAFREFTQLYDQQIQEDAPAESREQWPKLLRHLAFALMHDKDPVEFRLSMSREEAENLLSEYLQQEGRTNARACAERWLQDLLDYHLIQPVIQPNYEEHIEFRHQLIQEYYAAEYLLRLLPKLSDAQLKRDYLNLLKWTEPITLMLVLLNDEELALRVVKIALNDIDLMLGATLIGKLKPELCNQIINEILATKFPEQITINLLRCIQSNAAILELERILNKEYPSSIHISAIQALGHIGSESASSVLAKTLKDPDMDMRKMAAYELRNLKNKNVVSQLLESLINQDENSTVRVHVAVALGNIGDKSEIKDLIRILDDKNEDPSVRMNSASALRKIINEDAISYLEKALQDEEYFVSHTVARELREIGESAKPTLCSALLSKYPWVRSNAAFALAKPSDREALKEVVKAIKEELLIVDDFGFSSYGNAFFNVLSDLIQALGYIGISEAYSILLDFLSHKSPNICMVAIRALGEIGGHSATANLKKILDKRLEGEYLLSSIAAEALGSIGDAKAVPVLIEALTDEKPCVRDGAIVGLARIRSRESLPALIQALEHDDTRKSVIEAIGEITKNSSEDSIEIIAALIPFLTNDSSPQIRMKVAEVLGKLRNRKTPIAPLLDTLHDEESSVQIEVVRTLGKIFDGQESICVALLKKLEDPDAKVCDTASKTLGEIGFPSLLSQLWQLCLQGKSLESLFAIAAIQNRCKFYNYQIWQESNQGRTVTQPTQSMAEQSKYNFPNAQTVQIIENNSGQVIGEQSNYAQDQELKDVLGELKIFLTQLQEQHPQITTETQALEIIDAEFTAIEHSESSRVKVLRKQLLNPERHLQATKATLGEVVKHYLEESIWAKAIITYLDKLSEEPNQGA